MAPKTRSATKASPGRSTRNSVYGRPPASPPKPRKSPTKNTPLQTSQTHDPEVRGKATSNGTPWLACRDAYGIATSIALSETGEGIHIRWYYPEDDREVDEDEDADVQMAVDEGRDVTPPAAADPSNAARRPFPQTPVALHSFDAGSVIQTPIKKPRPLQPSPPRIGDKGIRCLYEKGGVLRELNDRARVVLRHPIGSSANLTREQVERLEDEREERIVRIQVERLLEQKRRAEEEAQLSDGRYEEDMETDVPSSQRDLQREVTNGTILISNDGSSGITTRSVEEIERALGFYRGPNGELLDENGQQMLGREGTILVDSTYGSPRRIRREEAFLLSADSVEDPSAEGHASGANGLRRARFGPHGTELII